MIEMLSIPFMQRAMLAGLMVGFLGSYFGAFVVQRGLSFLGNGLAHAAFGGVALGILLDWDPLLTAGPFTLAVAAAIVYVQHRGAVSSDTAIGVFFAVSMALGVIFLSQKDSYSIDAFHYLFGSMLAVSWTDVIVTGGVCLMVPATAPLWGRWAFSAFDRELAESDGVSRSRDDYYLSLAIAVTVVVCIKLVGIALVAAFLVVPAAAARMFSRTFAQMTLMSMIIGVSSAAAGLTASYHLNVPPGPAIILIQAAVFLGALARGK